MTIPRKSSVGQVGVVVCDFDTMGCELLRATLSRSHYPFNVLGSATDSASALEIIKRNEPDVVLLSATLQDGPLTGFRLLRETCRLVPKTRAVMLLHSSEHDLVIDAFRAGASGVFARSNHADRLGKCLYSVHKGQIWATALELQFLLEALAAASPLRAVSTRGVNLLTRRETQVVQLVAEGLTNREISRRLSLSEHTVKNYLFRVYDKLGVSSRVELTLYALAPAPSSPGPSGQ